MPKSDPRYLDLGDLLPEVHPPCDHNYASFEREVITPALKELGYTVNTWYTGEGDSFGPLTRCVEVQRGNSASKIVVYG